MPIHPLIVHFPIALLLTGAVVEIVNAFVKKESISRMGTFLILIGVITGIFALLTGDGAEEFAYENWGRAIHDTVELHSFLAGTSIVLFGIIAVIKLFFKQAVLKKRLVTTLIVLLSAAGIITLAVTGHLGGKVVYEQNHAAMNKAGIISEEE